MPGKTPAWYRESKKRGIASGKIKKKKFMVGDTFDDEVALRRKVKPSGDTYPDYDQDFGEDFKKIDAKKMATGGIVHPQQEIKGLSNIQIKGRKFQGVF